MDQAGLHRRRRRAFYSPTGALGMNTGMQDAVDIGWKLAAVSEDGGGPALLKLRSERKPIALRNVEASSANLERMLAPRLGSKPPEEIFEARCRGGCPREALGRGIHSA